MLTAGLSLHESLLQDVERKSVALDVHLRSSQTVASSGSLEVHIAQVVFVTENVAQHSILVLARILDETHGDAADGLLDGYTSVHQSQCAGTNGSH